MPIPVLTGEAADAYCLNDGEAAALLAGHPWTRFTVIGDSVAEGLGEASPGFPDEPWADRIAAELADARPGTAYTNLGRANTLSGDVRATQLEPALAQRPDLVLVAAGGFNALSRSYDPDAVGKDLHAMAQAFRDAGAEVILVSMFDGSHSPAVPEQLRAGLRSRFFDLADRTRSIAADLGTLHVDLTPHPASGEPGMYASDGRHGTRRAHAISAAETVRVLGARLRAGDKPAG
ncbi:SGNH/GDSL hydrolase family protein [Streptomyces sp. SL13]|uniref:SGNH/GDSL hydrolase family protein n=1 Tax=Streptantibioticus silvisoli TaxID=2705255 RepID=A0AA90K9M6_9ACTN|nr:SGNH/GDSL hydrolase family protein [Streptantibioticus silvisoli]MDI5971052.1 SGNH/GDSL hydrolase family protein [Streptantibioticus silvisoli]